MLWYHENGFNRCLNGVKVDLQGTGEAGGSVTKRASRNANRRYSECTASIEFVLGSTVADLTMASLTDQLIDN